MDLDRGRQYAADRQARAQAIARAERQHALRISVATIFEIVALHIAGRLRLAQPPEQWVEASLDLPGVRLAELKHGCR